jgi:dihydroxyacetone kinase-like protein
MRVDRAAVERALLRVSQGLRQAADELNALDAVVGDGDLGTTLARCADALDGVPFVGGTVADLLQEAGGRCAAASGSSFATLLGAALRAAARGCRQAGVSHTLGDVALGELLGCAAAGVAHLGEVQEGDKTLLDAMLAVQHSRPLDGTPWTVFHAEQALHAALKALHHQPGRIGRARLHAGRIAAYDDPGMVAVLRMVQSL